MANSRARLNQQLFNQAVGLGYTPQNFGGQGGGGAYTNYLRGLIAQGPAQRSQPQSQPKAPDPIQPAPPPQKLGSDGGNRLKINKKSKRRRSQLSGGTTQQRINLNTSLTGSTTGGVGSVGGGS